MRFVQFHIPGGGERLGLVEGEDVFDLSGDAGRYSFISLLAAAGDDLGGLLELAQERRSRPGVMVYDWAELQHPPDPELPHLLMPLTPPEVWGFGVTYRRSAEARDADVVKTMDSTASIYDRVYHSERPECFFKATASRCVGPNGPIGIRGDSLLTATEPELAYVLGGNGEIIGYTVCNDVSAWDLERDNPLYLPQSKIFTGCCALGPVLATADEIADPYDLDISCRIMRGGEVIYEDSTNSGRIGRTFEELNACLYRDNPIPAGTVVSTGTGIMVPNEYNLREGDIVEIEIEGIGVLSNPAVGLP